MAENVVFLTPGEVSSLTKLRDLILQQDTQQGKEELLELLQQSAFPLYIPENKFGITEGYYTRNTFVGLLRSNCRKPRLIYFLADMLEG